MITAQIRKCRRLIAQAREVVISRDYEQAGKPSCDWDDSQSRSGLINGLVTDGLAVLEAVKTVDLDTEQADAVGLLGVVVGQDVEPDPEREGKWRITRGVAPDRTIFSGRPPGSSRSQNTIAASRRLQSTYRSRTGNGNRRACQIVCVRGWVLWVSQIEVGAGLVG